MKIGQQHIHHTKSIARRDKYPCLCCACPQFTQRRRALQRAQTGRAYRHNPPAACTCRIDCIHGCLRYLIALAVHGMLMHILGAHRLKRAGPHMQGHVGDLHAFIAQGLQHGVIKVQTRRGSRHRTRCSCKNSLVTRFIFIFGRMRDVGRQRQTAKAFQQIQHRHF